MRGLYVRNVKKADHVITGSHLTIAKNVKKNVYAISALNTGRSPNVIVEGVVVVIVQRIVIGGAINTIGEEAFVRNVMSNIQTIVSDAMIANGEEKG